MARTAMKDRPEEPSIASPVGWAGTHRSTSATIQPNVLRDFRRGVAVSVPGAAYKTFAALGKLLPRRLTTTLAARAGSRQPGRPRPADPAPLEVHLPRRAAPTGQ